MSNQGWHAIRPRIGALTASAFSPPAEGGGTVTAPAATTEDLPDTDTPTAKTFGSFTDTEGLIDNYVSTIVDIVGTTTASGSGLGPYTYSGAGPGTAFVHLLTARDASNNPLATAVHGVDIMPSEPPASGSLGWVTLADYDLTTVDTASAITTTTGDIALTVASAAFVSLVDRTGSGSGNITPTNGTGVIVETVGAGSRSMAITHDWAGDGVDASETPVVIEAEYTLTTTSTGTNVIVGAASAGSSALSGNVNFCLRAEDAGVNVELAPRVYKSSATNDSVGLASAAITTLSVSVMRLPEGLEIGYSLGALPSDPRAHTYRRTWSWSQGFAAAPSDFSLTDTPRAIFHVFNSAGTAVWTRARFRALGVV